MKTKAKKPKPQSLAQVTTEQVDAKWRWHFHALLALRNRLLRERASLLRETSEPMGAQSLDPLDSATDESDHERVFSEISADQDALNEVDDALRRIMDGNYGICQETHRRIAAARLKAVPWTRFSQSAEARFERAGAASRPRPGLVRPTTAAVKKGAPVVKRTPVAPKPTSAKRGGAAKKVSPRAR